MQRSLRDIGYMCAEEPVIVLPNGQFQLGHGKVELDVMGCRHCGAVIQVHIRGMPGHTRFVCRSCDAPICRYCATELDGHKGACFPIAAQVEYKLKHGDWPERHGLRDYRQLPRMRR
jgi:hypothetical protein